MLLPAGPLDLLQQARRRASSGAPSPGHVRDLPDSRSRAPRPDAWQWREHLLAYFETNGLSNGGTEAINLFIEKTRRLAQCFRNFDNYRLRILLAATGTRHPPHAS